MFHARVRVPLYILEKRWEKAKAKLESLKPWPWVDRRAPPGWIEAEQAFRQAQRTFWIERDRLDPVRVEIERVKNEQSHAEKEEEAFELPTEISGQRLRRLQKRENGDLFQEIIKDREMLIDILLDTLGRGIVTKNGKGKNFISRNSQPHLQDVWVNLETGFYYKRLSKTEASVGDLFNLWVLAKNCSREEAIEAIRYLVKEYKTEKAATERVDRRRRDNQNDRKLRDIVFEAIFPEGKTATEPWYGTEGQLRKALEKHYGIGLSNYSYRNILQGWEESGDQHRFVVTSRVWTDSRGHVNKRRFVLTPTGVDTRWEDAVTEAAEILRDSEEDRMEDIQRNYERYLEREKKEIDGHASDLFWKIESLKPPKPPQTEWERLCAVLEKRYQRQAGD
jgi:hypothetical protein